MNRFASAALALLISTVVVADPVRVSVDWRKTTGETRTALTVQMVPEPQMRREHPIHREVWQSLRELRMSYARMQPWFPYPRLSIAALEPPADGRTSWDFRLIDPVILDFYAAQEGRPVVLNWAIPDWMFAVERHRYPDDPDEIDWDYELRSNVGTKFRDPSFREAVDYFARLAEWYIKGGFTDEFGKRHTSGHKLRFDYWEVLNEQDFKDMGHRLDPQTYTAFYDAAVTRLRLVDPTMKFSALALASAERYEYFEYFLDPRNHQPGIPVDMVSYHRYITAPAGRTLEDRQQRMFAKVDEFMPVVRRIEDMRKRLSPGTKTFISEFGFFWGEEYNAVDAKILHKAIPTADRTIPEDFWPLGASVWAYGVLGIMREGVDLVAAAELMDYPDQFAGTNILDWSTGEPNAVYRVVKLMHDEFPPGSKFLETAVSSPDIAAQAFETPAGRRVLLINKTMRPLTVSLEGVAAARARMVDGTTNSAPPREARLAAGAIKLQPMATAIVYSEARIPSE